MAFRKSKLKFQLSEMTIDSAKHETIDEEKNDSKKRLCAGFVEDVDFSKVSSKLWSIIVFYSLTGSTSVRARQTGQPARGSGAQNPPGGDDGKPPAPMD